MPYPLYGSLRIDFECARDEALILDSAYVFIGGLSYDLTEGDVLTILSQFGEIVDINLPRDKATGKTKGFGFVMYEDQRSTVLAVDNMNGAQVLGRTIRVGHQPLCAPRRLMERILNHADGRSTIAGNTTNRGRKAKRANMSRRKSRLTMPCLLFLTVSRLIPARNAQKDVNGRKNTWKTHEYR